MPAIMIGIYLLFSCFGLILIKTGGAHSAFGLSGKGLHFSFDNRFMVGIVFYMISFLLWIVILQKYKLSYIIPVISGLSYTLIVILSYVILHEKISSYQWWGIVVILVGLFLVNMK